MPGHGVKDCKEILFCFYCSKETNLFGKYVNPTQPKPDQNLHQRIDYDTGIYFMKLIEICSNDGFFCFMKLDWLIRMFVSSLQLWISSQHGIRDVVNSFDESYSDI
jgi:hypothetical protein